MLRRRHGVLFFTWKWNFIKLENKTAAPGKVLEGSYFHSVFSLVKDPTEREYPAQCGSGSGSICCKEWGWGMFSVCGALLLTWVASLQTARREPPGVCPKGGRSLPRRRTARGEPVGTCRRQPGRGVRRAVHVPWEPAAQGPSMGPAGVALCGCLSLGCFQACSCAGLEAEQLCLRNLLPLEAEARHLSNRGMGVSGGGVDLLFQNPRDWQGSLP